MERIENRQKSGLEELAQNKKDMIVTIYKNKIDNGINNRWSGYDAKAKNKKKSIRFME